MGDFRDPAVVESWHASQLSHPARGEQLDLLLALIEQAGPRRVLDVGVGSGLVAERVLERVPRAKLVGVDFSPAMLARARVRLTRFAERAELINGDLTEPDRIDVAEGPFDVALSVQTLHNIAPDGQQRALSWLARTLVPDGLALLLDKVLIPERLYDCYRLLSELPVGYADYQASETANGEWPPLLETHLAWLRDAGLDPAVLHLRANYALVVGRR